MNIESNKDGCNRGELAQMVERSLSMREVRGSMPRFSIFSLFSPLPSFFFAEQSEVVRMFVWKLSSILPRVSEKFPFLGSQYNECMICLIP